MASVDADMGGLFLWALVLAIAASATPSEGAVAQWCVADPQAPDAFLQNTLDWACSSGGADCSSIQPNAPCFDPNTMLGHASVAFNSYWQKFKQQGASCYFNSAAFVTETNPSYGNCVYPLPMSNSTSSPVTSPNFPVYNASIPGGIPNFGLGYNGSGCLSSSPWSFALLVSLTVAALMFG